MEVFLERLVLEFLFIAAQIAFVRFYEWLRARAGAKPSTSRALVVA